MPFGGGASIFVTKQAIQSTFQQHAWQAHLVVDQGYVTRVGDETVKAQLRRLNYRLCKRLLHRRFAEFPLEDRIHCAIFFQGMRDAGTRHAHVIMRVPASVPVDTPFRRMKLKTAIQTAWLQVRDRDAPLFLWARLIDGSADSKSVATYVSRELTPTLWEREDLWFSQ